MYDKEVHKTAEEVMTLLDNYLAPTVYVANSKEMTIADLSVFANYTALKACGIISGEDTWANIKAWTERCAKQFKKHEEINIKGAQSINEKFQEVLQNISE